MRWWTSSRSAAMTTLIVAKPADVAVVNGLLNCSLGDKPLQVVITEYVENRRRRQENLYRKWTRLVAAETGNDAECLHKFFAKKFLGTETKAVTFSWQGKTIEREVEDIVSTTGLTVKAMSTYMAAVEAFCLDTLGIRLPASE